METKSAIVDTVVLRVDNPQDQFFYSLSIKIQPGELSVVVLNHKNLINNFDVNGKAIIGQQFL
ncbi:MAG TPA: hypothetical protein VKA09_15075 [Nitrososphaeraceae archaeon]|nr:hypothetical protein [Nitrososphaeraceae archaeon]